MALAAIGIGVPLALMVWVRSSFATGEHATIVQPVPFDHRIHAHALRVDCTYCHATVTAAAPAGLPPTAACVGCHNKSLLASAPFAPVRTSLATHTPIAWRRVNALPDFVFFNHSIHIAKGVGCETCHGRVDQMAQVSQATPLSMGWCLSCHRDPAPNLRPRSEITTMGWAAANHAGSDSAATGERFMQEYGVARLTTCSTCHR
ncbi:MAG: cytochrome c3 family protein [bacterium]